MDDTSVSRYWNANAPAWASQVRMGYDMYRERINNPALFALIGDLREKDVIDLGCGEGYNTRILARQARSVLGVDVSDRMIELAREAEQVHPLGIKYEVTSFSDLRVLAERRFDAAVSFMALMDGADYVGAVAEIASVLRPGGILVFSILHPCFATSKLGWLVNQDGEKDRLIVGDYFEKTAFVDEWSFSKSPTADDFPPFQVPRFPRTLSEYLNPLCSNGFRIERIEEPCPDDSDCREYPSLEKWRRHAALFLHVRATKSSEGKG